MMFCEKPIGEIADVTKLAGFEFTKYIKYNETGEIIALRALNLRKGIAQANSKGRFNPDAACTRAEIAAFLYRMSLSE